jgi:NAD(P)-dependent dehydrogenase (short-subunit alcohol dehydrogenase family)
VTDAKPRTALVTGANRGIGLEVSRQLARQGRRVLLAARTLPQGEEAAHQLAQEGLDVAAERLDVAKRDSIDWLVDRLAARGEWIDVLVNNAGVMPETPLLDPRFEEDLREALKVNFRGAVWTSGAFVPGMVARGYGRVVNVSSGWGSFAEGLEGPPAYAISKAALNALTVKLAQEVRGDVKVNAACPGWVRTDMGGAGATRSVEEGADTIVWLATLPADGPNGGFFRSRRAIRF